MKTSTVGIVSVAILLVVTGVGFGIAQAGGIRTEQPVLSFQDMEALEQGSSSSSYVESRPVLSFGDQETIEVAKLPADDMQLNSPIETGSLPAENPVDSSKVTIEGRTYSERVWKGDIDGH